MDKFLAKQMAATEAQHTTQVLQQDNTDANDGGYQESSFYEDISNLSYIKDFQKSWIYPCYFKHAITMN